MKELPEELTTKTFLIDRYIEYKKGSKSIFEEHGFYSVFILMLLGLFFAVFSVSAILVCLIKDKKN